MPTPKIPEFIRENLISTEILVVDGVMHPYHVLYGDLEPGVPNFYGEYKNYFFISENVPTEFREHVIRHEIREFYADKKIHRITLCSTLLLREFKDVPLEQIHEYYKFRGTQLKQIIDHYVSQPPSAKNAVMIAQLSFARDQLETYGEINGLLR